MKKTIVLFLTFACFTPAICTADSYLDYADGEVDIRDLKGAMYEAVEGDELLVGYSVITGPDGYAEVQSDGSLIRINENTIFKLMETEKEGKKTDVLSCLAGSVYLKMKSLTEDENGPLITTQSAVLGVRGTAFSVFTGIDGASLIAVDEGKVAVSAAGESVELAAEEGVEVRPGEAPGEKFPVLRGKLDFRTWNEARLVEFDKDPVEAIGRVKRQMDVLIAKLEEELEAHKESLYRRNEAHGKLEAFGENEKNEREKYYKETVFPIEVETSYRYLNVRYYALSALSLRRYVCGRMYVTMKTSYINKRGNTVYEAFLRVYGEILSSYTGHVVPHLVAADI
ncbi:MAG: FecR domain-containing protein [Spirochaetales bacterium]|nr:FecR domain-containing protein [Spirochaetales bacterium]